MFEVPTLQTFLSHAGITPEQLAAARARHPLVRRGEQFTKVLSAGYPVVLCAGRPLAVLLTALVGFTGHAWGQGPVIGGGGANIGQTIVRLVQILYQLLFVLGIIGVGFFVGQIVISGGENLNWRMLGGAGACFGVGTIVLFIYNASKGNVAAIDTSELGGN